MDSIMTALSFVLLLVIVVTPISMIVYHAFFHQGQFSGLDHDQFTRYHRFRHVEHYQDCDPGDHLRNHRGGVYAWLLDAATFQASS